MSCCLSVSHGTVASLHRLVGKCLCAPSAGEVHTRKGKVAYSSEEQDSNGQLKVGGYLVADLQCHQFHFQRQCRPYLEASGGSQMQMRGGLFSAHCFPREQPGRYLLGLSITARYFTLSQAIA